MKKGFTSIFCLFVLLLPARQLHTIKSGSWQSDSVWYNQMIPTSNYDTILVQHHLSLDSDLVFDTSDFLLIDTNGSVCGNCDLVVIGPSKIVNEGFLGLYYLEIDGDTTTNLLNGYIDVGDSGIVVQIDGTFIVAGGCVIVHYGPQLCVNQCGPINTYLLIDTFEHTASFETAFQSGAYYQYSFSDGGSLNTYDTTASYAFQDTGTYSVQLVITRCCSSDTIYRTIHILNPPPPPPPPPAPPPCQDDSSLYLFPNPTDAGFTLRRVTCADEPASIKIYAMNGQLVYQSNIQITQDDLDTYISTVTLASACYIVEVEMQSKIFRRRLVVLH